MVEAEHILVADWAAVDRSIAVAEAVDPKVDAVVAGQVEVRRIVGVRVVIGDYTVNAGRDCIGKNGSLAVVEVGIGRKTGMTRGVVVGVAGIRLMVCRRRIAEETCMVADLVLWSLDSVG